MSLTKYEIARMIDLSAVQADHTKDDIRKVAEVAIKHNCICTFALPALTPFLIDLVKDYPDILVGGVIGFPSGGTTTTSKVHEAIELKNMGCDELDMVLNIGMLKSGNLDFVREDIAAVKEAAGELPLKVIFECHYLTDNEMRKACEICAEVGVAFVKTGTGWAPTGATLENVALMKECVGDKCRVKAAGGVRDKETLIAMYKRGVTRFGIGVNSAINILEGKTSVEQQSY
jgi:deoxyribose-phosphate aldolase